MTKFEIETKEKSTPFNLGDNLDSVFSHLKGFDHQQSKVGDTTIPNSKKFIVGALDLKLVFDETNKLVFMEFFNKPDVQRTVFLNGVEFDFKKKSLDNLKSKGVKILLEDEGSYILPDFNVMLTLSKSSSGVGSCLYAKEAYFQKLLSILEIKGDY